MDKGTKLAASKGKGVYILDNKRGIQDLFSFFPSKSEVIQLLPKQEYPFAFATIGWDDSFLFRLLLIPKILVGLIFASAASQFDYWTILRDPLFDFWVYRLINASIAFLFIWLIFSFGLHMSFRTTDKQENRFVVKDKKRRKYIRLNSAGKLYPVVFVATYYFFPETRGTILLWDKEDSKIQGDERQRSILFNDYRDKILSIISYT